MSTETAAIARRLGAGFNEHIRLHHGPAGDYASEPVETSNGHGLVITVSGVQYGARVERLPSMTTAGPLTPGQCWAALKDYLATQIKQDLGVHDAARDASDMRTAAAHGALVAANRATMAKMQELERK